MTRVGDERLAEMLAAAGDYIANYVADFDDDPHADPVGEFNPYTIRAIITELVELRKEVATVTRIATDRRYMMEAYYSMLGPLGREVADQWKANGVLRQHTSWGPEAWKLTGEERARLLLDIEHAPKTRIDNIDTPRPLVSHSEQRG